MLENLQQIFHSTSSEEECLRGDTCLASTMIAPKANNKEALRQHRAFHIILNIKDTTIKQSLLLEIFVILLWR